MSARGDSARDGDRAEALVGLWEFVGRWDADRQAPVPPATGSTDSLIRELLFFDADGSFVFAKYPRREPLYFDPDERRLVCLGFDGIYLRGTWRLEGSRLIESVRDGDKGAARSQAFDLPELSASRLIVREPTPTTDVFFDAVYARQDVEGLPAAPLAGSLAEERDAGSRQGRAPGHPAEELARLQGEQEAIAALLRRGMHNSAHRRAQRSVRDSARTFGADDPNTAGCLCTVGACLVRLGAMEAAVVELERAHRIYEKHFGPHHPMTARALNNLAPAYRGASDFRAALAAARDAVLIRASEGGASPVETASSVENLGFALSGLGMLPEAAHCYFAAAAMLAHGGALPLADAVRRNVDRLAQAIERDPRFAAAALPLPGTAEAEMKAVEGIIGQCSVMLQSEPASNLFALRYGCAAHGESYRNLMFAIRRQQQVVATASGDAAVGLRHLRDAQTRVRKSVRLPVGTLKAFLKCIDRSTLGPKSQATLLHAFPNFGSDQALVAQRENALREHGIDPHAVPTFADVKRRYGEAQGVAVATVPRQFRRYAGENNLPAQRYSSVCIDASGDDRQTLCRELFEYTDPRLPGLVFAGDTYDRPLMQAMGANGLPLPRVPGILVFMIPPADEPPQRVYRKILAPVLEILYGPYEAARDRWDGLSIVFIPTAVVEVEIDDVVDLRLPDAQEWLFSFFKEGDGAVWMKNPTMPITSFAGMLPALVHPEFGGSAATTSIGSWMRSAGAQGLVYPSARSNAAIQVGEHGLLQSFHGWNFVDYRDIASTPDTRIHLDNNDWYGFLAGRQEAPVLRQDGKSWVLHGVETRYAEERARLLQVFGSVDA